MLFLGGTRPFDPGENLLTAIVMVFTKFFIMLLIIDSVMPRYRPDRAVRFLWKYTLSLSTLALTTAFLIPS